MFMKTGLSLAVLFALMVFASSAANAHDVIPGVTGFFGRVLHPFIITEHMFCFILAGLIAGLYGPRRIWISLGALISGVAVGFLSQAVIPIIDWLWMLPLLSAVFSGLLVLSGPPLGTYIWLLVIGALGFAVGLETDPEGVFLIDKVQTLGGLVIAASILLLIIGWPLRSTSRSWVRILARVISSWITAISMLVLALSL